jgi:hypothetical protein
MTEPSADEMELRVKALNLAVFHHGLANLSSAETNPAGWETICRSANYFVRWLHGDEIEAIKAARPAKR